MDIEAERAFCSNFACCGIPLRDLHALFDHLETSHHDHDAFSPLSPASTSFSPDALSTSISLLQKPETGFSPLPPLPPASPPISDCSSASSATSESSATSSSASSDSPVPCIFSDQEPHAITATPVSALATMRPDQPLAWSAPAPSYPFVHGYGYSFYYPTVVPYAPVPLRPPQPAPPDGPSNVAANPSFPSVLVPVSSIFGLPPATTLLRPSPSPQPTPLPPPPAAPRAAPAKAKAKRQVTSNARAAATSAYLSTLGRRLYDTTEAPRASGVDASAFDPAPRSPADDTHAGAGAHRSGPRVEAGANAREGGVVACDADDQDSGRTTETTDERMDRSDAGGLAGPPQKKPVFLKGKEKTYVCPVSLCVKAYLNPNGLKYHIEKGSCVMESGAPCPVDAPLAPATSWPPTVAAAGSTISLAATTSDALRAAARASTKAARRRRRPGLRKSARLASSAGQPSPAPAPSSPAGSRSPAYADSPASDSDSDSDSDAD